MLEMCPSPTARTLIRKRVVPTGQRALVRVDDHRGVEQRRGLDCVLLAEVGADEQAPLLRHRIRIDKPVGDEPEPLVEGPGEVPVPAGERLESLPERTVDLLVGQRQDAVENRRGPRGAMRQHLLAREEQAGDDAGGIGPQVDVGPRDQRRGHRGATSAGRRASCSVDSAARVDSAPWFRLIRVECSPSEQPPVALS